MIGRIIELGRGYFCGGFIPVCVYGELATLVAVLTQRSLMLDRPLPALDLAGTGIQGSPRPLILGLPVCARVSLTRNRYETGSDSGSLASAVQVTFVPNSCRLSLSAVKPQEQGQCWAADYLEVRAAGTVSFGIMLSISYLGLDGMRCNLY